MPRQSQRCLNDIINVVLMSVFTAQKMKFSIKDFFSKCDQNFPVDLVILTEEILNRKLHFCAVIVNLNKVLI